MKREPLNLTGKWLKQMTLGRIFSSDSVIPQAKGVQYERKHDFRAVKAGRPLCTRKDRLWGETVFQKDYGCPITTGSSGLPSTFG